MAKKASSKSNEVIIDFSKEEGGGGGNRIRVKEGDYHVKILKARHDTSAEKGTPGLVVTFRLVGGKHDGKKFEEWFYLTPKSLWRVRKLLEAVGMSVPAKKVRIPTEKLRGKELGVTLTDDEYEGRISSRVSDVMDLDDLSSGGVDDEEEEEDLDEDEESDEDEDEDEDDDEDLEEVDLDDEL